MGVQERQKVLKKAAHLPKKVRVSGGRGSGRNTIRQLPGELPIVTLRVQILGCRDLLAKDRGGTSDPYVVTSSVGAHTSTFS